MSFCKTSKICFDSKIALKYQTNDQMVSQHLLKMLFNALKRNGHLHHLHKELAFYCLANKKFIVFCVFFNATKSQTRRFTTK